MNNRCSSSKLPVSVASLSSFLDGGHVGYVIFVLTIFFSPLFYLFY